MKKLAIVVAVILTIGIVKKIRDEAEMEKERKNTGI